MLDVKLVLVSGRATKREIKLHLPAMIGRSDDSDVTICHPLVSRQHCELSERDGMLVVSDSGSRNGTFVRKKQITEVVIRDGDEFTVGPLTFKAVYLVPEEDGTADKPIDAQANAAPTEATALSASNEVADASIDPAADVTETVAAPEVGSLRPAEAEEPASEPAGEDLAELGLDDDLPLPEPEDEPSAETIEEPLEAMGPPPASEPAAATESADITGAAAELATDLADVDEDDFDLQLVSDDADDIENLLLAGDAPREDDSAEKGDTSSAGSDDAELSADLNSTVPSEPERAAVAAAEPIAQDVPDEIAGQSEDADQSDDLEAASASDSADEDLDDLFMSVEDDLLVPAEGDSGDEPAASNELEPQGSMSHREETEEFFIAPLEDEAQESDEEQATPEAAEAEYDSLDLLSEAKVETEGSDEPLLDELPLDASEPSTPENLPVDGDSRAEDALVASEVVESEASGDSSEDGDASDDLDLGELALGASEPLKVDDDEPLADVLSDSAELEEPDDVAAELAGESLDDAEESDRLEEPALGVMGVAEPERSEEDERASAAGALPKADVQEPEDSESEFSLEPLTDTDDADGPMMDESGLDEDELPAAEDGPSLESSPAQVEDDEVEAIEKAESDFDLLSGADESVEFNLDELLADEMEPQDAEERPVAEALAPEDKTPIAEQTVPEPLVEDAATEPAATGDATVGRSDENDPLSLEDDADDELATLDDDPLAALEPDEDEIDIEALSSESSGESPGQDETKAVPASADTDAASTNVEDEAVDILDALDEEDGASGDDAPDFSAIGCDDELELTGGVEEGEPDFMALDDVSSDTSADELADLEFVDSGNDTTHQLESFEAVESTDNTDEAGADEPLVAPSDHVDAGKNGESNSKRRKKRSWWPFGKKGASKKKKNKSTKKTDADAAPVMASLDPIDSDSDADDVDEMPMFEPEDQSSSNGDEAESISFESVDDLASDAEAIDAESIDDEAIDFLSLDEDDETSSASSDDERGEPVESTPPSGVSDEDLDEFLKGFN